MDTAESPAIEPRAVPAGRGVEWIGEAFGLYKPAWGVWIGILLIWAVISIILTALGLELVNTFLNPIFQAGVILGCVSLARGEGLRVEHLFAGFRSGRIGPLLLMSVLMIVALLIVFGVAAALVVGSGQGAELAELAELDESDALDNEAGMKVLLIVLVCVGLAVPIAMAVWFAPALIVLRGLSAWDALVLSFRGCLRNILPFLVYGLVALAMLLVAVIPLLLGLLVAAPVLMASVYTAYRDIFPEPELKP